MVDDHAISARHAVAVLSRGTGQARWAKSAAEALELALNWYPHLIFMDLYLRNTNGLDLLGRIRKQWPADRPVPKMIVATGDDTVQDTDDLKSLKIDRFRRDVRRIPAGIGIANIGCNVPYRAGVRRRSG